MNGMHYFWGMGWSWIIGIVILFFVIWFVVKSVNQNSGSNQSGKSALDILKERYARGEISKEEFEEKKKDIV